MLERVNQIAAVWLSGGIKMKKIIALVLAVMLVGICCVASADKLAEIKEKGKLVVGSNITFPPYEFYWTNPETGAEEIAGFDMMLARGIAEELGVECEIADQAFSGLITALSVGELDCIISGMAIKPERLEVVDFSDPYFSGEQILLVRKEDFDKYKTVADMKGKKIGAQTGSLQAGILSEQFAESEEYIIESPAVLALDLVQGNIDGWLITDLVAKQYMVAYPDTMQISEVPVDYDNTAGIGVAVQKGDNAFLLEVMKAYIAKVKADGTFDGWVNTSVEQSASLLQKAE